MAENAKMQTEEKNKTKVEAKEEPANEIVLTT